MLLFGELLICPAAAHGEPIDMPLPLRCPHAWVPANVVVTNNSLLELSNEMASRSPAFRRRLQQIGQTPTFRARIRFVARITATPLAVAQTAFSHAANGGLFADIQIPTRLVFDRQDVRMIAHEIEHVMEQIEGIDLHALARTPHSGVYRVYDTRKPLYETDRATLFGQIVENDFRNAGAADSCVAD
jgi:hypothetical protein